MVNAQSIGEWNVYSSYSTVNSISTNSVGEIYVLTQGGLFIVENQIIRSRFTTIDGMHRLDGTKSKFDERNNRLIIGYPDGVIDLFDTNTQEFSQINDIQRVSEFTSKGINDIEIIEDEILVATDFGVVVFDREEFFVTNSYLNLGELPRGTQTNDITFLNDSIFVATTRGVASGLILSNLIDASNWIYKELNQSVDKEVIALEATSSELYAIANDSLFNWDNGIWSLFETQTISSPEFLESDDQEILIGNSDRIIGVSESVNERLIYSPESSRITTIFSSENSIHVGSRENGFYDISKSNLNDIKTFNPVGPYLNFFSDLEFDYGTLLASATVQFPQSDPFNNIRGYYILRENEWENYNRNTNPVLSDFRYSTAYSVDIAQDNYFIGSWGDGVAIQSRTSNEIEVFDNSNSGFSGISANRTFVVISGIDTDSRENTWAISFISNFPLNVYSNVNKEWSHFPSLPINSDELYYRIFVDSNDNLWIPLIDIGNNGKGLLVVDPGQDPFDDSDDTYRKLTTGNNSGNLPDDNVIALTEDKNGEVWIGTNRGLARFIFPNFIVSSNNPSDFTAQWLINADTSATSRFLLRDVSVSAIAVNSSNQKWVGSSNQGLWLLNEDGSEILARYTADSSPLISDNILDIAIDDETGEVFISTDLGLISIIETAILPVSKMDELKVYPNPFVYANHNQIIIDDLSEETSIKVVGSDGSVFANINSRGGRIVWNALDDHGNELASGVYFIVALDNNGSEKGIGKVVIIR
jgi:hypothetical protein